MIDGRNSRAVHTREALIGTCKFLMCEGTFRPSMVAVAALSNRATRSAFQHFPTVDRMYAEAIADETVRRAVLLHAANSDTSCLDWPVELQNAVIHAVVFGRPIGAASTVVIVPETHGTTPVGPDFKLLRRETEDK